MKTHYSLLFLVGIFILLNLSSAQEQKEYNIAEFHTKWFWTRPKEGFYQINVGLPNATDKDFAGAKLIAMGDINNDKLNDLVTVDEDQTYFQVHYFKSEGYQYQSTKPTQVPQCYIQGVFINKAKNNQQNLIFICQNSKNDNTTFLKTMSQVIEENAVPYFIEDTIDLLNNLKLAPGSQPFFLDLNGDLQNEVIFTTDEGKTKIAIVDNDNNKLNVIDFYQQFVISNQKDSSCKDPNPDDQISIPHSNSFLDLDGDCMPDIFLTKSQNNTMFPYYYEIYIQRVVDGKQMYCLVQTDNIKADSTTKQIPFIEFGDIDRDAMTDMIFYRDHQLISLYNLQTPAAVNEESLCKQPSVGALTTPIFESLGNQELNDIIIQDLPNKENVVGLTSGSSNIPGRIRLGDMDADGFPEVMLTLTLLSDPNNTQSVFSQTFIYKNLDCGSTGSCKGHKERRQFDTNFVEYSSLAHFSLQAAQLATFIDIDEDGRLDIFMQRKASNGKIQTLCIYNNYVKDTFFIKALMVYQYYGDPVLGASYRFVVTDLNDNKYVITSTQLYQTSYSSLQMPYSYIGVGRSNNYVESFNAAFSLNGKRSIRIWTPIIPNSQLIIFAQNDNVNDWNLELFINPTNSLALIVIACLICLFIIGVVIIILHIGEKQEDKRNRLKAITYF